MQETVGAVSFAACEIYNNECGSFGGGMYVAANAALDGANIHDNTAGIAGGGLFFGAAGVNLPVNFIYMSMSGADPAILFGGTWQLMGQGRTLIGVDTANTNFNTVLKTGGTETHTITLNEMASHRHARRGYKSSRAASVQVRGTRDGTSVSEYGTAEVGDIGGGQAHNNVQPFVTVNMWRRVS